MWCAVGVLSVSPRWSRDTSFQNLTFWGTCPQTPLETYAFGSNEGLMIETPATHHIPQAKNIPYQPLLFKLIKQTKT